MGQYELKKLHLDQLTASVALVDLAARDNDLIILGQAIDEEWRRFGPALSIPPGFEKEHLISTMGNRLNAAPTTKSYYNTQLIQPDPIRAENREMADRFLRGKPLLTAEIRKVKDGYRLETAILRVGLYLTAVLDWAKGHATFYVLKGEIPETVMIAAAGHRLGSIVNTGHCDDLKVTEVYIADYEEMKSVLGQMWEPSLAIRTALPEWTEVEFTPIYQGDAP